MRKHRVVIAAATLALGAAAFVSAQQKPVSARPSMVVYKSPT
jgi:hypothetical protein